MSNTFNPVIFTPEMSLVVDFLRLGKEIALRNTTGLPSRTPDDLDLVDAIIGGDIPVSIALNSNGITVRLCSPEYYQGFLNGTKANHTVPHRRTPLATRYITLSESHQTSFAHAITREYSAEEIESMRRESPNQDFGKLVAMAHSSSEPIGQISATGLFFDLTPGKFVQLSQECFFLKDGERQRPNALAHTLLPRPTGVA